MKLVCTLSMIIALAGTSTVYAGTPPAKAPAQEKVDNPDWRGTERQVLGKPCAAVTRNDCLFVHEVVENCPQACGPINAQPDPNTPAAKGGKKGGKKGGDKTPATEPRNK